MNFSTWNCLSPDEKNKMFQDYIADRNTISPTPDLVFWLDWVASFVQDLLQDPLDRVRRKSIAIKDERYVHQLVQLENSILGFQCLVGKKKPDDHLVEFPCHHYTHLTCCSSYRTMSISKTRICPPSRDHLRKEAHGLFSTFLVSHVSSLYYILKLRLIFDMSFEDVSFPSLSNPDHWEIICGEEKDIQILAHPLLSHPADFLIHKKREGSRYVDKAKFEYYMEDSLPKYNVVLTKTPSPIPKLVKPVHKDDVVTLTKKKENNNHLNRLYHESIKTRRNGKQKRNKPLSRILKETRKRKKTLSRLLPRPDVYQHDFDIDDETPFFYDDYFSEDDDNMSWYDTCDYYYYD